MKDANLLGMSPVNANAAAVASMAAELTPLIAGGKVKAVVSKSYPPLSEAPGGDDGVAGGTRIRQAHLR
jgi:hypothetical protein